MKNKIKRLGELVLLAVVVMCLMGGSILIGKYVFSESKVDVVEKFVEKPNEPTENIIKRIADEEEVSWLMVVRIIDCESRWDKYFKEKMKDGSYDRGLFAFNTNHYKQVTDDEAFNPEIATRIFIQEYKAGNLNNWLCARSLGYVK